MERSCPEERMMNRIMPCMGAHPPGGEEVVVMSLRVYASDVEVDVGQERLSTTPPENRKG
jgi:hypothetical protein